MKIKTITGRLNYPADFDQEVNEAQEEGWRLVKREVLPGTPGNPNSPRLLYAELVQLDEPEAPPEPQPADPVDLIRQLRDFCDAANCATCPLHDWCPSHLPRNEGPADWEIPGEEAGL